MDEIMDGLSHLLDDIDQVPRIAHATYRSYAPGHLLEHDIRAQAACTYCHMQAEADRRFIGRDGVVPLDVHGLKVWAIGDHAVMRLKKMDEDGATRNYPTEQAKAFDSGEPLPGLPLAAARISAGYLLNPTQTEFIRAQISRPRGRRIRWCVAIVPASTSPKRWVEVTQQGWLGP
jgi:hypothetical protein